jgi:diguanylate cyclase (GGDEF)-like protein/PAS domain S-box-containing protein
MSDRLPTMRVAADAPRRQQRLLLGVCVGLLLALVTSLVIAARLFDRSFSGIEVDAAQQQALQLYRAFNADLRQLEISNRDYAEWQDAADFVASHDSRFVASNFTPDALTDMHVDLAWVVDGAGQALYSGILDRASTTIQSPAPAELLAQFARVMHGGAALSERAPAQRLLRTTRGLAAFSVVEIRRSRHAESTGAHMLFVRFIAAEDIARVREALQFPLELTYLPTTRAIGEATELPRAVRDWAAAAAAPPTLVRVEGARRIAGYALARDIDLKPAAILATSAARDISALGARITRTLLGGIALLLFASSAAVLWLVLRLRRGIAVHEEAERRHASIVAQLHEAIMLVDAQTGRIVEANDALLRALATTPEQIRSRTALEVYPDLSAEVLAAACGAAGKRMVHESRMRDGAGGTVEAEVSISLIESHGRQLLCLVGHDISHRRAAEHQQRASNRKLAHMAQHDPLTGLPNRLYLRARLPRALRVAASTGRLMALIYLDLDHFKKINDSRGHAVGDQLLQTVAQRLRAAVNAQDVVVRMGGDEFVIVAALLDNISAVEAVAQRLQAAVQAPMVIDNAPLEVSASLGIALYPNDGLDMDALLKHADIALYQAKEAGRARHRLFEQDMLVRVSESVAIEQALRRAVGTNQLHMEYQPVIDLLTGHVVSLEALMRWRHPEWGLIPPSQFIPIADASGLTNDIGVHALREVLAQLRAWLDADVPVVPIAVNISPVQIETTDFYELVARLTSEYRVEPQWLNFEITETALMKDPEGLAGTLRRLRARGSKVLIDDFGTGYSGLSHLAHLPVDVIKIDGSFVNDAGRVDARASIVTAVIDMAKKLQMTTIAEGVETAAQAELLRDQGCDFAQGYLYSKPVTARHCKALLHQLARQRPLTETLVARALRSA